MGLDDPPVKMRKSNPQAGYAVDLLDSPDGIRREIHRARTGPGSTVDPAH